MKKCCTKLLILVLACGFFLSGCAQMTAISEDDEDRIAIYSANLIGRFNRNQKRGIVPVVMTNKEEEMDDIPEEDPSNVSDAEFPLDPLDVDAPHSDGGISSLGDVLSIPGIASSYKETIIAKDYGADGGFLVHPQSGNSFVVVRFTAKNITDNVANCNIRATGANFMATVQDVTSAVDRSFIIDDLPGYNGTIAAGDSIDLALLFQFPTAFVSDLSGLSVACVKEGVKYEITL